MYVISEAVEYLIATKLILQCVSIGSVTMTIEISTNTGAQQDTIFNPNPNPNPTTKQHTIANNQPNIVTCPMYFR